MMGSGDRHNVHTCSGQMESLRNPVVVSNMSQIGGKTQKPRGPEASNVTFMSRTLDLLGFEGKREKPRGRRPNRRGHHKNQEFGASNVMWDVSDPGLARVRGKTRKTSWSEAKSTGSPGKPRSMRRIRVKMDGVPGKTRSNVTFHASDPGLARTNHTSNVTCMRRTLDLLGSEGKREKPRGPRGNAKNREVGASNVRRDASDPGLARVRGKTQKTTGPEAKSTGSE